MEQLLHFNNAQSPAGANLHALRIRRVTAEIAFQGNLGIRLLEPRPAGAGGPAQGAFIMLFAVDIYNKFGGAFGFSEGAGYKRVEYIMVFIHVYPDS